MGNNIKEVEISIIVITYNHSETIQKALNSVFSQKINVPYEVIVIDDASDDGTKEILVDYAKQYSQIRLFCRKYNNCYPTKNIYYVLKEKARGRYLAFLEGDDCWIYDRKLAEQYSILENNRCYSAVMTDVKRVDKYDNELSDRNVFDKKRNNVFTLEDFHYLSAPGGVASLFCRNPFMEDIDCKVYYKADFMMGDVLLYAILLTMGDIFQMDKKTALYRYVSVEGNTNYNSLILNDRYMFLRRFRYWIRIEKYIRDNTKSDYNVQLIDDNLIKVASGYKWRDVWKAVYESDDKSRILKAAVYHFIPNNGIIYNLNVERNAKSTRKWMGFWLDKRPVVLFGAGIWASDFLDNYSWIKTVRFLVDNDERKVGKAFKGYVVKKPAEIMHFKDKVAVLITSGNYEEQICRQLEQMGITDYYCYYSMQEERLINKLFKKLS